jgi:hypothetical protein
MAIIYSYPRAADFDLNNSFLGIDQENKTVLFPLGDLINYINVASIWGKIYGDINDQLDLQQALNSKVLKSTSISTNSPLTGGGDLSSSRTLSISQASVSSDGYLNYVDWNTFNNKQPPGDYITSLYGEASATGPGSSSITLSNTAVVNKVLSGLIIEGNSIDSNDNILEAFGKLQNQINGLAGGTVYQSTWNASTNNPTLTSSVGTKGYYYVVSVAGSTNLNGVTDWNVGDWAIYNGSVWQKVDNTDSVISINGLVGNVTLNTTNVPEGDNLYFTQTRVSSNSDVTANTAARHSPVTLGAANGLTLSGQQIGLGLSSTSSSGSLSSSDWNNFNNKVPSSRSITINGVTQTLASDANFTVTAPSNIAGAWAKATGNSTIFSPTNEWLDMPEMTVTYIPKGTAILATFNAPVYVSVQDRVSRYRFVVNGIAQPFIEYNIFTNTQMIFLQNLLTVSEGVNFNSVNTITVQWYATTNQTQQLTSLGPRTLICTPIE